MPEIPNPTDDTLDLFTRVGAAIAAILSNNGPWSSSMFIGNFLNTAVDGRIRNALKGARTAQDNANPAEVMLSQKAFTLKPAINSGADGGTQDYVLSISSNTKTVIPLNTVKELTWDALRPYAGNLGLPTIVRTWTIRNSTDQDGRPPTSTTPRLPGFAATLTISVEIYKPRLAPGTPFIQG